MLHNSQKNNDIDELLERLSSSSREKVIDDSYGSIDEESYDKKLDEEKNSERKHNLLDSQSNKELVKSKCICTALYVGSFIFFAVILFILFVVAQLVIAHIDNIINHPDKVEAAIVGIVTFISGGLSTALVMSIKVNFFKEAKSINN